MKYKKKSLTLLEVLVALVFLGFIFTFLLSTFSQTIKTSSRLKNIKTEAFSRFHVHRRLFLLFSHLGSLTKNKNSYFFYCDKHPYTSSSFLAFTINGILDPDPQFCGVNHCSLHLQDKTLFLTITPENNPSLTRQEILLHEVKSIDFTFYKQKLWIEHSEQIKKLPLVTHMWDKDLCLLPSSFDLKVERYNHPSLILSFPLVSKTYPITYP
jgi:hypothetical protein